eukprot:4645061-Amphidinium_carterae.1
MLFHHTKSTQVLALGIQLTGDCAVRKNMRTSSALTHALHYRDFPSDRLGSQDHRMILFIDCTVVTLYESGRRITKSDSTRLVIMVYRQHIAKPRALHTSTK